MTDTEPVTVPTDDDVPDDGGDRWRVWVGDTVTFEGQQWRVSSFDGTRVTLRSLHDTSAVTVDHRDLFEPFTGDQSDAQNPIDLVDTAERARAFALERHILDVEYGVDGDSRYDPTVTTISGRVAAKLDELRDCVVAGESLAMSRSRFMALRATYKQAAADAAAAAPVNVLVRGNKTLIREPNLDPDIAEAVRWVVRRNLNGPKYTFKNLCAQIQDRLDVTVNQQRTAEQRLVLPSSKTMRCYFARTPEGRYTFRGITKTKRTNAQQVRVSNRAPVFWPGDSVEYDGTRANTLVVFPDGTVARPWVYGAADVALSTLLAARASQKEKGVDAALLLFDQVTPMTHLPGTPERLRLAVLQLGLEEQFDGDYQALLASAAARPMIVPKVIRIDNGKVYRSNTFMRAAAQLRATVVLSRPRTATDKPVIERVMDTLDTRVFQHLPGYVGNDVSNRGGDLDPKTVEAMIADRNLLTFDEFEAALDLAVLGWQFTPTKRDVFFPKLRWAPNQQWAQSLAATGFVPRPADPNLMLRMLPSTPRQVTRAGVQIGYRYYWSPRLSDAKYRNGSGIAAHPTQWPILVDPRNIVYVWLSDPTTGDVIPLRWKQADVIGQPMSDALWRAARNLVHTHGDDSTDETVVVEVCRSLLNDAGFVDGPARQAVLANQLHVAAADRDHTRSGAAATSAPADPEGDLIEFVSTDPDDEDDGWEASVYDPLEESA